MSKAKCINCNEELEITDVFDTEVDTDRETVILKCYYECPNCEVEFMGYEIYKKVSSTVEEI